ncbi:MAG: hypothetical protein AB1512_32095 [Thermodesulfobacteriota bacterium]
MDDRGSVLFAKEYHFRDGTTKAKLFVLLNTPGGDENYLLVRTTSQKGDRPTRPGCIEEKKLFFILANTCFFEKDTWLEFQTLEEWDRAHVREKFQTVGKLSPNIFKKVLDCLFRTMSEDITNYQRKMLDKHLDNGIRKLKDLFDKRRH